MHGEVTEFKRLCATLAQHRRGSVGEPLDTSFLASWPASVQTSADFAGLVSAAYQMWQENWKLDIGFLLGYRRDGAAHDFDRLIYQLRTHQQHTDNSEATARFTLWTRAACAGGDPATADDWLSCGTALMTELNAGVRVLCQTAARGDRPFRSAWRAKVSETPEAAVTRVADDLGLQLSQWRRQKHALQVTNRWKNYRLRPGQDATGVLASFSPRRPSSPAWTRCRAVTRTSSPNLGCSAHPMQSPRCTSPTPWPRSPVHQGTPTLSASRRHGRSCAHRLADLPHRL